ncbi:hypothetical protein Pta02_75140 [Planobispora takensis]|uniref:Uncharacterized protein n=1 Tax=Planobispora takensis TaxID=1367882 RepID=A0A8J3T6W1_9ACTN|nr:hypothetical protein Pta02_75140 [Planobispora takensis]
MSGSFAAAVRERAGRASTALETARHGDDVDALALAEAEWEHVMRLARTHGITLSSPEAGSGEVDPAVGSGL